MNSAIILVANAAYAAAQFIQIIWIAKIYGPDALGIFGLAIGIFAPFVSIISAGQRFVILSDAALTSVEVAVQGMLRTVAITSIFIIALLCLRILGRGGIEMLGILAAVAIYRIVDGYLEMDMWCAQKTGRRGAFVGGSVNRALAVPIACGATAIFHIDLLGFLWTSTAVVLGLYLLGQLRSGVRTSRTPSVTGLNPGELRGAFMKIMPIGIAAGLESLAIVLPRYFLAAQGSLLQVATYVMFTQFAVIFGLIASAKLQADLPRYGSSSVRRIAPKASSTLRPLGLLGLAVFGLGVVLNVLPASAISLVTGEWFVGEGNLLLIILPVIAWIWYGGGYLSNVAAIATTKSSMLYLALLLVVVLCVGLLVGLGWPVDYLSLVLGALTVALAARFVGAVIVILRSR
jgi:hypothetical protein